MPLVSSILQAGFVKSFKAKDGATPQSAAKQWAQTYATYAQTGASGSLLPVLTGLEAQTLEKTLFAAIAVPSAGLPAKVAAAWATGVMTFWSAPPVIFSGGGAGLVSVAAAVVGIITPGLTTVFSNNHNTEESCASQMASILDTATRLVIVQHTLPPPPAPIPLS